MNRKLRFALASLIFATGLVATPTKSPPNTPCSSALMSPLAIRLS